MPKLKSHRGVAKRFKITAKGKIKRYKGYKSHILQDKPSSRKRRLSRPVLVDKANIKKIRKMIYS